MSEKSGDKENPKKKLSKAEMKKRLNIINSSYKCTICGSWVKYPSRKRHLRKEHNLCPQDIKSYFLNKKAARDKDKIIREKILNKEFRKDLRAEYEKNVAKRESGFTNHDSGFYKCGEKVSGAPFVKIIYNAIGTNRRKH